MFANIFQNVSISVFFYIHSLGKTSGLYLSYLKHPVTMPVLQHTNADICSIMTNMPAHEGAEGAEDGLRLPVYSCSVFICCHNRSIYCTCQIYTNKQIQNSSVDFLMFWWWVCQPRCCHSFAGRDSKHVCLPNGCFSFHKWNKERWEVHWSGLFPLHRWGNVQLFQTTYD